MNKHEDYEWIIFKPKIRGGKAAMRFPDTLEGRKTSKEVVKNLNIEVEMRITHPALSDMWTRGIFKKGER